MTLKVGIDSYSYHRFFGEVYEGQESPPKNLSTKDFLKRAKEMDVDGVSLESCFIESFDAEYLAELKAILDDYNFDRVWAWGHPDGLEGGINEAMLPDMIKHISYAKAIGADVMRVVGSSLAFRFEPHGPQLEKLTKMFKEAVQVAEEMDVKLAVENHFDFDTKEFLELIEKINSPYFGLTFDTGNFMRLLDEPVKSMQTLGKHVFATHIKDVKITPNTAADEWFFFSCVAVGDGYINVKDIAKILSDLKYPGMLAVELDFPHPEVGTNEDAAVEKSIKHLKEIVAAV
ncbi:MAG: sugar phosphate isomerase/epimerase [Anaerolineaceae bacterium]|nr:sugar phosphate isomerase/epimerase [Anaerolineaceae bacterium]